jgi:hypothetical protein
MRPNGIRLERTMPNDRAGTMERVQVPMPSAWREKLNNEARVRGLSRSDLIRLIVGGCLHTPEHTVSADRRARDES